MFVKVLVISLLVALLVAVLARQSDGSDHEERYVVRTYDTLWSIAASHYGGDPREAVWRIQRRNGLEDPLIRPGQVLVLP